MKIKPGDKVKITDLETGRSEVVKYLGKADEWCCQKGFSRRFKRKKEKSIFMFPDSYLKKSTVEIVKVENE